ncbi:thiol peroxidase [Bacillus sp. 196mf]|uniref:thiol peroxidase n=1 Tax=Bacillus sp. 196mf TaxID=1761754 RepID=UPI000D7CB75A|nr:thiol peroxidase [Bacillus sp. 196mf]PYE88090.1 thiol peroxidase (atypical 2-Cys peroxiredoxin) [Bacillus sp. 196mf]
MNKVNFLGNPIELIGNKVEVGDLAPNFELLSNDLSKVNLDTYKGQIKLISVVPSIDTEVCDQQTRYFNEQASNINNVKIITISTDLPFAQKRWCNASGLQNVLTLSDHLDVSFGKSYGVLMSELRLLARAIFVVDSNDTVVYVEYVDEVTNHPNYKLAFDSLKTAK